MVGEPFMYYNDGHDLCPHTHTHTHTQTHTYMPHTDTHTHICHTQTHTHKHTHMLHTHTPHTHTYTHTHLITCSVSRVRYIRWLVGVASSDLEVQRHRHLLFPRMLRGKGKPNTPPYGEGGGVYLQWQREGREEKREEGGGRGGGEGRENDTM